MAKSENSKIWTVTYNSSYSPISTRFSDFSDYTILELLFCDFSDSPSTTRFSDFSDYTILLIVILRFCRFSEYYAILRFFQLYDSSDFSDCSDSSNYSTNLRGKGELEPFKLLFCNMITYNTLWRIVESENDFRNHTIGRILEYETTIVE